MSAIDKLSLLQLINTPEMRRDIPIFVNETVEAFAATTIDSLATLQRNTTPFIDDIVQRISQTDLQAIPLQIINAVRTDIQSLVQLNSMGGVIMPVSLDQLDALGDDVVYSMIPHLHRVRDNVGVLSNRVTHVFNSVLEDATPYVDEVVGGFPTAVNIIQAVVVEIHPSLQQAVAILNQEIPNVKEVVRSVILMNVPDIGKKVLAHMYEVPYDMYQAVPFTFHNITSGLRVGNILNTVHNAVDIVHDQVDIVTVNSSAFVYGFVYKTIPNVVDAVETTITDSSAYVHNANSNMVNAVQLALSESGEYVHKVTDLILSQGVPNISSLVIQSNPHLRTVAGLVFGCVLLNFSQTLACIIFLWIYIIILIPRTGPNWISTNDVQRTIHHFNMQLKWVTDQPMLRIYATLACIFSSALALRKTPLIRTAVPVLTYNATLAGTSLAFTNYLITSVLPELINENITTDEIADSAISTTKIAANAISATKIAANAISTPKIATNAVSTSKIAESAVSNTKIAESAVSNSKISTNAVSTSKIATNAVSNSKIAESAVSNTKLATNAVSNTKLAANAVSTTKIADSAVSNTKIAESAVSNTKLATNAVSTTKIADSAVSNIKIAENAISNDKIQISAVDFDNLSEICKEDIIKFVENSGLFVTLATNEAILGRKTFTSGLLSRG